MQVFARIPPHWKSKPIFLTTTFIIMPKKAAGGYYAVGNGHQVGVYNSWAECEQNVKGYSNAQFKKFATADEAAAFVDQCQSNRNRPAFSGLAVVSNAPPQYQAASYNQRSVGASYENSPLRTSENKRVRNEFQYHQSASSGDRGTTMLPFLVDSDNRVNVYVDGSCTNNGRPGAKAGVGVYFGDDHPLNISEPVEGLATNNNAEIQAARKAINLAADAGITKLRINTDSDFLHKCATEYLPKWKRNGWRLANGGDVKNRVELEKLDFALKRISVVWNKVPAHSGIHGNEMADKLANAGASRYVPRY